MKLNQLIKGLKVINSKGNMETEITGISYNSNNVKSGQLFAAIPGTTRDGHEFIPQAKDRGASAFLVSKPGAPQGAAVVQVGDVRMAMGQMAGRLLENPSHEVEVIGITGTNGKTTISFILESIFNSAGRKAGVIGTVNYRYPGVTKPAATTTPESVDIHSMLAQMVKAGVTHVVIEVSSHALDQRRVSGIRFGQAIFTNLSQDHLDYHADMDDYFKAKRKLFTEALPGKWELDRSEGQGGKKQGASVINMDDEYGAGIMRQTQGRLIGYALSNPEAEVRGNLIALGGDGIELEIKSPHAEFKLKSDLLGRHNAINLTAAAASALELGLEPEDIRKGVENLERVPGRLEPVKNEKGILILVDYAHTPDALKKAISASRELCSGRLIVVFGCGGDRDRTKRPHMGEIAGGMADLVVVTSDNPRTENPAGIIKEILPGIKNSGAKEILDLSKAEKGCLVEENREKAVTLAVKGAQKGDVILIAGKGHEDYQIIGEEKIHFDDREVAQAALEK